MAFFENYFHLIQQMTTTSGFGGNFLFHVPTTTISCSRSINQFHEVKLPINSALSSNNPLFFKSTNQNYELYIKNNPSICE
ncbi:MAG TPA: hypothetical protein PL063_00890 [Candidatus Cloacimonadota bacterium]|nr:hypothetical protein [Candidatus Cloacimonadota bacterium]HQB40278.1 hypothetical protein [Candidatus Cloacimonadota bacterium]